MKSRFYSRSRFDLTTTPRFNVTCSALPKGLEENVRQTIALVKRIKAELAAK
jgi:hypothetical protein